MPGNIESPSGTRSKSKSDILPGKTWHSSQVVRSLTACLLAFQGASAGLSIAYLSLTPQTMSDLMVMLVGTTL